MKKNLITVLKKLLTAFGGDIEQVQNNAVDIIDKIADNASGSGSGGLSVLTLYLDTEAEGNSIKLYKNIECTEGYSSVEEANEALLAAASIRVIAVYEGDIGGIYFPSAAWPGSAHDDPAVYWNAGNDPHEVSLYIEDSESGNSGEMIPEVHNDSDTP